MPGVAAIASTSAAVLVASLGYSTVEPWMARSMARSSRPICEGPSAPISTPAWEPTSRRSTTEMAPIRMKSWARDRKAAKVAYYRVTDATKSVVAIENVAAAINQIAQTTLRKVVGQHTLDQTLAETDTINLAIREILDRQTEDWGVVVTLVELKDIQLPDTMQRAMARQAEAEREKRAKIIAAEGEQLAAAQLGAASDVMMAHPWALQLRNLQTLVELGVDQNTTVVFPAPLMSTIQELGNFLAREQTAVTTPPPAPPPTPPAAEVSAAVGQGVNRAPTTGGSDTQHP